MAKRASWSEAYQKLQKGEPKRSRAPRNSAPDRVSRHHVSLYIEPDAYDEIKRIAIERRCRPHDVLIEALAAGLKSEFGLANFDALNEREPL